MDKNTIIAITTYIIISDKIFNQTFATYLLSTIYINIKQYHYIAIEITQ